MNRDALSAKEKEMWEVIRSFNNEQGRIPTILEIGEILGLTDKYKGRTKTLYALLTQRIGFLIKKKFLKRVNRLQINE